MDLTFLLISIFILGYLFGHRDLRQEKILLSISKLKQKFVSTIRREKVTIMSPGDNPEERSEEEEATYDN